MSGFYDLNNLIKVSDVYATVKTCVEILKRRRFFLCILMVVTMPIHYPG